MGALLSLLWQKIKGTLPQARVAMVGLDNAGQTTLLYQLQLGKPVTTRPTVGFNVETVRHRNVELNVWDVGGQRKLEALWRSYLNMMHTAEKYQPLLWPTPFHCLLFASVLFRLTCRDALSAVCEATLSATMPSLGRCRVPEADCAALYTGRYSSGNEPERSVRGVVFVVDAADHGRIEEARDELRRVALYADTQPLERERLAGPLLVVANKSDLETALSATELEAALGLEEWGLARTYKVCSASATTGEGVHASLDWFVDALLR